MRKCCEDELRGLLIALDRELAAAENPPPGFEEAIEEIVGVPSPIDEASCEAGVAKVRRALNAMTSRTSALPGGKE